MIRRPPRSTRKESSAASDVYKRQSYGKPSIGGIYGGEGAAIKSGVTGYLCNGNDLNAIYDTLLKILSNEKYKELGANAFEFSKGFAWNKIIKNYINLI